MELVVTLGGKVQQYLKSGHTTELPHESPLATSRAAPSSPRPSPTTSAEGDCYLYVPPDPSIEAAALGASESALPGTALAEALHIFTLDSGASRCFFRDSTTLTPLYAPVPVRLADPSGGPIVAYSSTVLPCLPVPSGSLSGLHLPSFSTKLVSTAALQDAMVTTTTPGGHRVSICTCTRTGRHLATFTVRHGSSLYTLAIEPPQIAASAQVSASGLVAPPCSCRLLSQQALLWHHRLGHPSLPRLRGMHSCLLVSGLPRSLPPLPPSPAPPCLPCVEGRQRAAPHSSSFPTKTAPLQTLYMDVWVPARVSGQGRECYFLLVVDDYTRYTTVFPLRSKGEVPDVLIPWIRTVHLQLREQFREDLSLLRLHSDRGVEFSSDLLREFCCGEGVLQTFTIPASTQQNGIAEHRIGLVMEFYHPTLRRVFPSQDVTFEESVPFYRLFPYRTAPLPPPPLFLAPGPPLVDPLPPEGPAPSGVSQVDPLPSTVLVKVVVASGASRGAASGGAEPRGAEFEGAGSGGYEPEGAEPGGYELEGVEPGGAEPEGAESGAAEAGDSIAGNTGAGSAGVTAGAGGTGDAGAAGPGGARTRGTGAAGTGSVGVARVGGARAGDTAEPGAVGAGAGGTGASGAEAGGAGAGDTGAVDPGAGCAGAGGAVSRGTGVGGTVRSRPFFVPLLRQVLKPESRPASRVRASRTDRRVPRQGPPPVPCTHPMALRPSSVPLHVPLPPPPESSHPAIPDPQCDLARVASLTVSRLLATFVTDPSFESTVASALLETKDGVYED
ncbi:unnamed protein product [Closterium sp. NIES-53]